MNEKELNIDPGYHILYSPQCKNEILDKISKHYPPEQRDEIFTAVQKQYEYYLKNFRRDLGGSKNSRNGCGGTYDCIAFCCYYVICKEVTSFAEIEEMEENILMPGFEKLKFADINKPFFKRLMYFAFKISEKKGNKFGDYIMHVDSYDPEKPITYTFTACPFADFVKQFGLQEIGAALCNADYPSIEAMSAKLIRKTTCINGCECDYAICGDKDPYCILHEEYRDEEGFRRNR